MSLESARGWRAHRTPASRDTLASPGTLVTMDCLGEMDETGQRATRGTQVPTTCACSCPPLLPTSSRLLHSFIACALSTYPLAPLHPSIHISLHRLEDTDRQPAPARPRLGVGYRAAQAIRTLSSRASHWVGLPVCPPASPVLQGHFQEQVTSWIFLPQVAGMRGLWHQSLERSDGWVSGREHPAWC